MRSDGMGEVKGDRNRGQQGDANVGEGDMQPDIALR